MPDQQGAKGVGSAVIVPLILFCEASAKAVSVCMLPSGCEVAGLSWNERAEAMAKEPLGGGKTVPAGLVAKVQEALEEGIRAHTVGGSDDELLYHLDGSLCMLVGLGIVK